jgi:hypothetical protein
MVESLVCVYPYICEDRGCEVLNLATDILTSIYLGRLSPSSEAISLKHQVSSANDSFAQGKLMSALMHHPRVRIPSHRPHLTFQE